MSKTTSQTGIDLLKLHEGLYSASRTKLVRASSKDKIYPYKDPTGTPTIGWGNTFYANGARVKLTDPPISYNDAEQLLKVFLKAFEKIVNDNVKTDINQNQFDALVCFVYNIGGSAFRSSSLLKLINANPNDPAIDASFKKWIYSKGKVLNGLVKRRASESALYFKKKTKILK